MCTQPDSMLQTIDTRWPTAFSALIVEGRTAHGTGIAAFVAAQIRGNIQAVYHTTNMGNAS